MSNFRRGVKASGDRFSIDSPVNNQRGEMLRQFKNLGEKKVSYDYERPVGPGILSIGADYDYGNNNFGLSGRYKIEYDDGGIATLPTPEGMERERVPLTDEQKDYLYDYMLDFMFKQKQREQMEQESIIPPFNYEGLEV